MTRLLHLITSPRGKASASRQLTSEVVTAAAEARDAHVEIDEWDLWAEMPPEFGPSAVAAKMAAMSSEPGAGDTSVAWAQLRQTFQRFASADAYVIGVPMWNGGVPWVLKLLIDTITQPGLLFEFDPLTGYRGLLHGKRAIVAYTSSVYAPGVGESFGHDHHATYFDDWLRFAGIDDFRVVRLQPSHPASEGYAERRAAALRAARGLGRELTGPRIGARSTNGSTSGGRAKGDDRHASPWNRSARGSVAPHDELT